jgi:pyruvate formate lyase activating enzyme
VLPTIGAFIESSLIEWPGKIATAIALQGCNLRCPYCHSAPLVSARGGESVPLDAILAHFRKLRGWVDGTVVSGGEPLMHQGVRELIEAVRDEGLLVKLDTNGTFPDRLAELVSAGLVDYIAIDVKAPLDAGKYAWATGVNADVEAVRRSIAIALESGVPWEARTTLCPAVLTEEDLPVMARELARAPRWYLQQFRPKGCLDPAVMAVAPWTEEKLTQIHERCRRLAPGCLVRGRNFAAKGAEGEALPSASHGRDDCAEASA